MNSSEDNGNNNKDNRTKVQLLQELTEVNESLVHCQSELSACNKELLQAKIEIKRLELNEGKSASLDREMERVQINLNKLSEDSSRMKEAVEKLKNRNEEIREEIKELKLQLSTAQDQLLKNEEAAKEEQKTTKKNKKTIEKKIEQLEEQIAEMSKKISPEKIETKEDDYAAAPKANFRIEITPGDDNYRMVIVHPLSKDRKVIEGLDMATALKFISKYLPKLEEPNGESELPAIQSSIDETEVEPEPEQETRITEVKDDMIGKPRFVSTPKNRILSDIRLKQSSSFLDSGQFLSSDQKFVVHSRLELPEVPSDHNVDIDTSSYNIRVVVKEKKENKLIFENDIADDLLFGVTQYEQAITVPRLAPGLYSIYVNAIVPFARIGDQKIIGIEVKD